MDRRFDEMEEKLAHQQVMLDDMSAQLHDQWQRIATLERALENLGLRFVALEEAAAPAPEITKPPHY